MERRPSAELRACPAARFSGQRLGAMLLLGLGVSGCTSGPTATSGGRGSEPFVPSVDCGSPFSSDGTLHIARGPTQPARLPSPMNNSAKRLLTQKYAIYRRMHRTGVPEPRQKLSSSSVTVAFYPRPLMAIRQKLLLDALQAPCVQTSHPVLRSKRCGGSDTRCCGAGQL